MNSFRPHVKTLFCRVSIVFLSLTSHFVAAANTENFRIQAIQIIGLRGLTQEAVLNQLPIQVGSVFDESQSDTLIKKLYETQWFDSVKLVRQGSQLQIMVVQRPILSSVVLKGIPQDQLQEELKKLGLVGGEFFDRAKLEYLKRALLEQSAAAGMNNAKVECFIDSTVEGLVDVTLTVTPGAVLEFASIRVIGAHAFGEKHIISVLPVSMGTSGTLNSILALVQGKSVICTPSSRAMAIQALEKFYKDEGYYDIEVSKENLAITPDRCEAHWIIELTEGSPYTLADYRVVGSSYGLTEEELQRLLKFKVGDRYSATNILQSKEEIERYFGEQGYLFAAVQIVPSIDKVNHQVFLAIQIDRGVMTYVRRTDFVGKRYMQDSLLRGQMRQVEGGVAYKSALEDSEHNLRIRQLAEQVSVQKLPVKGTKDQIDLLVYIQKEPNRLNLKPFNLSMGSEGSNISAQLEFTNLVGSGEDLDLSMTHNSSAVKGSKGATTFKACYRNNFFHLFGLSGMKYYLDFHFASDNFDWSRFFMHSPYFKATQDNVQFIDDIVQYIGGRLYDFFKRPESDSEKKADTEVEKELQGKGKVNDSKDFEAALPEKSRFGLGSGGLKLGLNWPGLPRSALWKGAVEFRTRSFFYSNEESGAEVKAFLKEQGDLVDQYIMEGGYSYERLKGDGFSRTSGYSVQVSGRWYASGLSFQKNRRPAYTAWKIWNKKPLHYFMLDMYTVYCKSFGAKDGKRGWIWNADLHLGTGGQSFSEPLPFFDTYHSGDFGGYQPNALGPVDSEGNMLGGSVLLKGRLMCYLPKPFSGPFLPVLGLAWPYKTIVFAQFGNVYEKISDVWSKEEKGGIRGSVGIVITVVVPLPMGPVPLYIGFAKPFLPHTAHEGKHTQTFNWGFNFT